MIKIKAFAKINFFLKITERDKEGYHLLDTVMASVSLHDTISVSERTDGRINIICPGVVGENSAHKAARLFQSAFCQGCGFDIEIEKGIPLSAGLGGSSADAAGVLYALGKMFAISREKLTELAQKCGSDTAFMLSGGFAKAAGRGEILQPFECGKTFYLAIAKPRGGVSSGEAYRLYDEMKESGQLPEIGIQGSDVIKCLQSGDLKCLSALCKNDLFLPAKRLLPQIGQTEEALKGFFPACLFMSGSGSSMVALFNSACDTLECAEGMKERGFEAYYAETRKKGIEEIGD